MRMVYLILLLNKEADLKGKHGDDSKAEAEAEAEDAAAPATKVATDDATRDITKK